MGAIYKLLCPDCLYEKEVSLGQGKSDFRLGNVVMNFSEETQIKIKEVFNENSDDACWNFYRGLGYCPSCNAYQEVPMIEITDAESKIRLMDRCTCNAEYQMIEIEDMTKCGCPICKKELIVKREGMWD